jgi:hypothetical protein
MTSIANAPQINQNQAYTGADLFLGFSLKFGSVIEHPMNASSVPMGEGKGFFSKFWDSLFKHDKY